MNDKEVEELRKGMNNEGFEILGEKIFPNGEHFFYLKDLRKGLKDGKNKK